MTICIFDCVTDVTDSAVTDLDCKCADLCFLNCPTDFQVAHCPTVSGTGITGSTLSTVVALATAKLESAKGEVTCDCDNLRLLRDQAHLGDWPGQGPLQA